MSDHPHRSALHALFSQHHRWLTARLFRHADDWHDAQDLSSETFLRVVSSRQDPARIAAPRAFLAKIGQRVLYRRTRQRALEQRILECVAVLADDVAPSPEELLSLTEAVMQLDAALQGLPPRVREAFLYSQLDELSYEEIAARLHVSTRTVTRYIRQALQWCWHQGYFE